ncbi:ImmA/IrrE family metallo-endopeptidase [Lachnospiraceae bacterium 64-25]
MNQVAVAPMSRRNIREIAKTFRSISGLDEVLYFPIVQFIELILPKLGLDYEIISVNEMGNAYGVTHTGARIMKIREDVYEGAVMGRPRDRFTLCHELGHFLLHTPDRVSFARGDVVTYMQPEWQANVFAGELMAPQNLVMGMYPDEIAEKCGMSLKAATIQYNEYHKAM